MDQVRPRTLPATAVVAVTATATATVPARPLLDRVPTQRGPQHPRDASPTAAGGRPAVVLLVLALLGGSAGIAQLGAVGGWSGREAVAVRVSDAQAAASRDAATAGAQDAAEVSGAARAGRADVVGAASAALDQAVTVLGASPHADPALRAQLQATVAALSTSRGGAVSPRELQGLTALAAARVAQVELAETAWLAQQRTTTASSNALAGAPAGDAVAGAGVSQAARIGAGGKVCTGEGMSSTEVSGADIAQQINIYRISNGMSALSVSRSPVLAAHAVDMAGAGGIWHSGHDNIVGCVSDGSAKSLVSAWAQSPPHNAQMLRGDVTAMAVGAAVRDKWLYGAVVFS